MKLKSLVFAVLASISVSGTAMAAPITGVAVQGDGSALPNSVVIENSPLGIPDAIKYFIPLTTAADVATCVFGVNCGTSSDSGTGGTLMSMFLSFTPVTPGVSGTLSVLFDDLDLINANDPVGFLEEVTVKSGGTEIISIDTFDGSIITSPNDPGNPGDNITELVLALDASDVAADPLILELVFSASSSGGKNTPEHLLALFDQAGGVTAVPLPAALPLFAGGLGIMGLMGWRRKRKAAAA